MHKRLPAQAPKCIPTAIALGAALVFSLPAHAVDPALNALGQSGGLVIPYGFTLPSGVAEAQYNDYLDPRYGNEATGSQIYWGAFGLFPYVEVSAGLANYPGNVPALLPGADHFILRHLMADVKVEVPRFFQYQPDIAFGVTDVGGQSHFFRSKYGVMSQAFGPATLTLGYGQGDRMDGVFGGAQLALWNTGLSLLAEDDAKTPYAGIRYQSPAISWLADASLVGTVMGSVRRTDGVAPRASVSIGVQIPLGKRFSAQRCADPLCKDNSAGMTAAENDESDLHAIALHNLPPLAMTGAAAKDNGLSGDAIAYVPPLQSYASVVVSEEPSVMPGTGVPVMPVVPQALDTSALETIAHRLVEAGLERVRVGVSGSDLIVEYENHRYNQNEADALGIVLGVASANAPPGIERIRAVIKKADEPIAEVSVDRHAYAQFVAGGAPGLASGSLTMHLRPTYDADSITWYGDARSHGLTRIQIKPVTSYLYGTEYGNFDFSVGADVEAFVPLWRGAELYGSYIAPIYNTKNMNDGRVFGEYRLRGGLTSAALAQSFWVMPQVFDVAAVGKFDYDYLGVENETTVFVPGRPDVVRLKLAYLHQEPGHEALPDEKNAVLTYRWVQPAWNMWIEAGVARYVDGDKGPLVTLTRWFDDVSVSVSAEHSGEGTFVGAAISFPLTPRQGMKPGISQLDGTGQFALDFRTRVSSRNYLNTVAAQNLDFPYSTQELVLNQGRFSAEYFAMQLYRMRDAYVRYTRPDDETPTAQPHTQPPAQPHAETPGPSTSAAREPGACPIHSQDVSEGQALAPVNCQ